MKRLRGLCALLLLAACGGARVQVNKAPTFQKWKAAQVVDAFRAAGLEAEGARPMKRPDDYGLAPMTDAEGVRFFIPSLGEESGGRVLSYAAPADVETAQKYYSGLGRQSGALHSWVYVRDNILVQINGALPEEKASAYESALLAMR